MTIQFDARVDPDMAAAQVIVNRAVIDDGEGTRLQREAMIVVGGAVVYLPLVGR